MTLFKGVNISKQEGKNQYMMFKNVLKRYDLG